MAGEIGSWTASAARFTFGTVDVSTARGKQRQRRRGWRADAFRRNPAARDGFDRNRDPHWHTTKRGAEECARLACVRLNRQTADGLEASVKS